MNKKTALSGMILFAATAWLSAQTAAAAGSPPPAVVPTANPPQNWGLKTMVTDFFAKNINTVVLGRVFQVIITIVVGFLLVGLILAIVKRITKNRLDPRSNALLVKIVQYLGLALIVINAFNAAKVDLSALLGAAGIVGIALGFAAQTSVSNFISGFFLVSEKTFTVGDILSVENISGEVYSIDALSVKIRTFDNKLVRIANETLIKSMVTNITPFSVRRMNIKLSVTHETSIDRVRAVLLDIADRLPSVLKSPEPFFMVESFGKDGTDIFFGVWFEQCDWEATNLGIHHGIKERFEQEGILLAHQTLTIENIGKTPPKPR